MKTPVSHLLDFGQSAWLDYISRPLIDTGKLKEMIGLGLRGVTSNPSIFDKAISSTSDYDAQVLAYADRGLSTFQIYDELTVKDIQDAADIFADVYKDTQGLDGYISLEVNPKLAYDLEKTVEEAKRLYRKVSRPNVMFKIPATDQGLKAVEELLSLGININATLIFSLEQYTQTALAYMRGIDRFLQNGGDATSVRSVASVFVSRIDTSVDKALKDGSELKGKAAVANSALIYKKYREIIASAQWKELEDKGANIQRVLWGSTSTKNPSYSDIKYVTELIGKGTVNTIPQSTFEAFLDHGRPADALAGDLTCFEKAIADLKAMGIDVDEVCNKLLEDGVAAFEKAFDSLFDAIEKKRETLLSKRE